MSSSKQLADFALAPTTHVRYTQVFRKFAEYIHTNSIDIDDSAELDKSLVLYINSLYKNGDSLSTAEHTFHSILFFLPEHKQKLPRTVQTLKGWSRIQPHTSHPPLTWSLTVATAVCMAKSGYIQHSIATLLAFHCYLRISEFTALHIQDILIPNNPLFASTNTHWAINLGKTKTGNNQSVTIEDADIITLLSMYIQHRKANQASKLFDFSVQQYRLVFTRTMKILGMDHMHFTPHSIRHGAATDAFLRGISSELIKERGRWSTDKARKIYIQSTRSHAIQLQIPTKLANTAHTLTTNIKAIFIPFIKKL